MNTEFNIADLEKALTIIKENPMLGKDNSIKGSSVLMTEHLFIAGAKTLAVAIADGMTEDQIVSRIKAYGSASAISTIVPGRGDSAAHMVAEIFKSVELVTAND